ncbi:MAG: diguanylate cyclase [Oscillospiraceae bacterium]|nr:diguanylate cyclase [Oscillospiraceae bacterium]
MWSGAVILILGNFLSICLKSAFPWDALGTIFNAFFIFLFLSASGHLPFALLIKRRILLLISTFCGIFLSAFITYHYFNYIYSFPFRFHLQNALFAAALIGIIITVAIYIILEFLTDVLYVKEDQLRAKRLREFSLKSGRSQTPADIVKAIKVLILQCISVTQVYGFVRQQPTTAFIPTEALQEALPLDADDALCVYLQTASRSVTVKQLIKSGTFARLTSVQKQYLTGRKISCIMPLTVQNTLLGILFLTSRSGPLRTIHLNFLDSVAQIASITLDNIQLYHKMYVDARTDSLTQLYNRYYFLEILENLFAQCPVGETVAVAMLAIDDFKLYNQLYGTDSGNELLRYTAAYLKKATKEKNGLAIRFSGKKFALVFPQTSCAEAFAVAQKVADHLRYITEQDSAAPLHAVTFSGGVCAYPTVAGNVETLLAALDNAVKEARQNGKDNIVVYNTREEAARQPDPTEAYNAYAPTIYALTATIDAKDHYTFNHSQNVAYYASALATAYGLPAQEVKMINDAAILHDIGKISIPEHILSKPSALTPEEKAIMQRHVENSIAIIKHLPALDYMVPTAISHHERWDGTGYPRGVAGEDIPLGGRCLAVADAFDAMVSRRPYKQPFPLNNTLQELRCQAGKQFDPALANLFVDLVENGTIQVRYPTA